MTIRPPSPSEDRTSYVGVIKSFNVQKGWGHIECEDTFAIYGKDIFLLRSALNGVVPNKGDKVYFSVTDGKQGIEATSVQLELSSGSDEVSTQGYIGSVKSWNPHKGWGHIICDTTEKIYGKDIFVMRSAVREGILQPGEQVSFHVTDGLKGPEAANVVRLQRAAPVRPAYPAPGYAAQAQAMYAPTAYAPGYVAPAYAAPAQAFTAAPALQYVAPPMQTSSGQVYYGTIKSYDDQKGWGHIACDATRAIYQKDMFVMKSALKNQDVQIGDQVRFCLMAGQKGPEATDVVVISGGGAGSSGAVGSWAPNSSVYHGTVKSFNGEKGWGHIECAEARAIYGKDIFLHQKQLNGKVPQVGTPLSFSVMIDQDGRSTATNVSFSHGAPSFQPSKGAWAIPRMSPY